MAPFIIQTHREKFYCNSRNWRKYEKGAQEKLREANKCDDLEFTLGCTIVHFCVSLFTVRQPGVEHVKLGSYRILHQRADAKGAKAGGGRGLI